MSTFQQVGEGFSWHLHHCKDGSFYLSWTRDRGDDYEEGPEWPVSAEQLRALGRLIERDVA